MEPCLLDAADLCDWLRISRSSLNRLVAAGRLPKPIRVLARKRLWFRHEVCMALEGSRPAPPSPPEPPNPPQNAGGACTARAISRRHSARARSNRRRSSR